MKNGEVIEFHDLVKDYFGTIEKRDDFYEVTIEMRPKVLPSQILMWGRFETEEMARSFLKEKLPHMEIETK